MKNLLEFICKECGATTKEEIISIGCIFGGFRILGKLKPYEAAKETIKQFKKGGKA